MKIIILVFVLQLAQISWCSPQRSNKRPNSASNRRPAPTFGGFKPVLSTSRGRKKELENPGRFSGDISSRGQSFSPPPSEYEEDYYYYEEEEPLPSGPTRRPSSIIIPEEDYYFYQDEDPLPSGPTREPPLPSGPTRRPGQPTTHSPRFQGPTISPALNQWLNLPLLTTVRPSTGRQSRKKNNIVDKTKIFASQDPNQEQFILPPKVNAGALPLSLNQDLSANQFPPFVQQVEDNV